MSERSSEPEPEADRDVWDSPAQREYEADPAAYDARVAARYAELQAAQAAAERVRADREAAAEARFWAMREAEAEAEAEIG
jgi:hypothetical protein